MAPKLRSNVYQTVHLYLSEQLKNKSERLLTTDKTRCTDISSPFNSRKHTWGRIISKLPEMCWPSCSRIGVNTFLSYGDRIKCITYYLRSKSYFPLRRAVMQRYKPSKASEKLKHNHAAEIRHLWINCLVSSQFPQSNLISSLLGIQNGRGSARENWQKVRQKGNAKTWSLFPFSEILQVTALDIAKILPDTFARFSWINL